MKVGDRVRYNRHFVARFGDKWPEEMNGCGEIVDISPNPRTGQLFALVDWEGNVWSCPQQAMLNELELA